MIVAIFIVSLSIYAFILFFRATVCVLRSRKLSPKPSPPSLSIQEKYAHRLSQMIQCATVSNKDKYDDTEFSKLRSTVESLFPVFHAKSELQIFSDDCWIYKLKGKDDTRRIMLMSHHDVAPVEGDWIHPPFSGDIIEGKIWGRGTVDTKTSLFSEFQALEELLTAGWVPPIDVYLGSSHNEETAGDGIPLAVHFFRDQGLKFDLILDEGGAVICSPMPGVSCKCAMVAVHEKSRRLLRCVAQDAPGHAGLSAKTNTPVVRVAQFIASVAKRPPFVTRLYPQVRAMFEHLSPHMSLPFRLVFANLWCFGPLITKMMPLLSPQAGAMVGTQCSFPSVACEGAGRCVCEAFLRSIDADDLESDVEALKKLAEKFGVVISDGDVNEFFCPADMKCELFEYVMDTVMKVFPHAACAPFVLPANTDARHFTSVCKCVVRFAPIEIDRQQFASVHSPNENIDVEAVSRAVEFYREFLKGLK